MKIAYLFDSGSSYKIQNQDDCFVVPMTIEVQNGHESQIYLDSVNITRVELEKVLNSSAIVRTSQPPLGHIIETIDNIYKQYDLIIAIPFSEHLSSTFNTILGLQKEYGKDRFLVANTNAMSITGNWFLDDLKEYIAKNKTINQEQLDELAAKVRKNQCGVVIVADTKRLIAGGRLKGIKGLIAKTFKFKLIIKYKGSLDFKDKSINTKEAIDKALAVLDADCGYSNHGIKRFSILANLENENYNDELSNYVVEKLNTLVKNEKALLPDCVIAHTGPNTFSILIESN